MRKDGPKIDFTLGIKNSMEQLSEIEQFKSSKQITAKREQESEKSETGKKEPDIFENGVNSTLVRKCLDAFTKNIDRLDKTN